MHFLAFYPAIPEICRVCDKNNIKVLFYIKTQNWVLWEDNKFCYGLTKDPAMKARSKKCRNCFIIIILFEKSIQNMIF